MTVITKPCGLLQANMYVVYDDAHNAIVIDPISDTCLRNILDSTSLSLKAIFLTHAHFDHAQDLDAIQQRYDVPSYIHCDDADALNDPVKNVSYLIGKNLLLGKASKFVSEGDCIEMGDINVLVHHTPGHSKGSVCYEIDGMLFSGDTLFAGGIGRCDLYGGDTSEMLKSLKKIAALEKNLKLYPGHGPSSTLLYEKNANPYLRF